MSIEDNLSDLKLYQDIRTVFSTLRPNQDKSKTTCKKLKLPSGIFPEAYQDYCNKAYDYYWLQITHLDYHCIRNKTRLPVVRSLYSQRTLFRVSFYYIEWVNSYKEHFTKIEVPQNKYFNKRHNRKAPINWFRIVSKYVKGGFPRDRVLQENLDTEEDAYSLRSYNREEPRVCWSTPTYKQWINKQNQVPST
jgi:hypothetical protein